MLKDFDVLGERKIWQIAFRSLVLCKQKAVHHIDHQDPKFEVSSPVIISNIGQKRGIKSLVKGKFKFLLREDH